MRKTLLSVLRPEISLVIFTIHLNIGFEPWIFVPYFWSERDGEKITSHIKTLYLTSELDASVFIAVLNSSLFYWWFVVLSKTAVTWTLREIRTFPTGVNEIPGPTKEKTCDGCS